MLLPFYVLAQPFGGNPPSIKWKKLESPSFSIIFPKGLEASATRVASIGERILPVTGGSIGNAHRKISIVLQNQTLISNGYVSLAPWRSEFFLTPFSNSLYLGSLNWTDMLTMHEIRHVQQFSNFKKGLSAFAWVLAGEQGQALANSAAIPDWFFEGDAVFQETLLSEQGRGRLPSFFNTYRAIDEAGLKYDYQQLRNGSLKRLLPDHYSTGYILVAAGRRKYGQDVWFNITDRAARFNPLIYPFQGAFKKVTKESFRSFVKHNLYQDSISPDLNEQALSVVSKRYVTDYAFPQPAGIDSLIVFKETDRDLPGFYWWINGSEKHIRTMDVHIDPAYSYRNGKIAFTSYTPDARWGWRNYSDIVLYDVFSGTEKRLTNKGKYFAPDISHDNSKIVSILIDPSGTQTIHILNAETGEKLQEFSDTSLVYTYPKFSKNDERIYTLVRTSSGKMGILNIDLQTGKTNYELAPSHHPLSFLFVNDDKLYFTAAYQERDRLMMYDISQKQLHELYARAPGVQQGIPIQRDSLIFTGSSAWGNRLFKTRMNPKLVEYSEWERPIRDYIFNEAPLRLDTITMLSYPIKKYHSTSKLFNIHSWRPYYSQPDLSFTLYGQNLLNTFQTEASVVYNENEGYLKSGLNLAIAKWYPWITMGSSYISGRNMMLNNKKIYWDEWNLNAGLRLPINLSKGRIVQSLSLASQYNIQHVDYRQLPKSNNIQFGYINNQLNWVISSQQARQHIFPRFAWATAIDHRFSVSSRQAQQLLLRANAYLPGILKTHHVVLNAAYQSRDTANQYLFSNSFPLSRGYTAVNLPRMWKWGVNYHFPITYPDKGLANIVYILRVRGNVFYDRSEVKSLRSGRIWQMNSTGAEVFFDTRWWNQQPLSIGIRYARLLSDGPYNVQPDRVQIRFILPTLF